VKPEIPAFHNNLGFSYLALGWFEAAVAEFEETLRLEPNFAMAHNNIGKALREQGQVNEAMVSYERAIALQADYAEAHFNRAEIWLMHGEFQLGWPEYEWRWELPKVGRRSNNPPRWDGAALDGRTIVVHTEQGLGDTIHFVRYMPALKALGGKVIVHCQGALIQLLAGAKGIDGMTAWRSPLPPFDVHEHLLNLPGVLHTRLENVPAAIPYLKVDPDLLGRWRNDMRQYRREADLLVGIAWKGSAKNLTDQKRSVPLSCFEVLAQVPGVRLVSLQKGPGTEQVENLRDKLGIVDLGTQLDEASGAFMDTAAVMANLDLVISCDTALPHLAGALGVPVWIALPLASDWRWMLQREDSPWYPSIRLFRQARWSDWDEVFGRIAGELNHLQRRATAAADAGHRTPDSGHS
jgi:hypothetical protein